MKDAVEHDDAPASRLEIAADWVDEFATLTPERRQELRAWLKESEENATAFTLMQRMMADVSLLEAVETLRAEASPAPASTPFDPPQPRRTSRETARKPYRSRMRGLTLIGAAAGLAAAAVTSAVVLSPDLRLGFGPSKPSGGQIYATTIGARSDVTLRDRSIMHLNADSRVAVLFSGASRDVRLERGEAMFDVAHDNAHPFKVAAGAVTVTDVGTVFDVERIMDATEVRVFRGAVSVAVPSARQRSLKAGEWLILDPDHGAVQGQFDPVVYQSWRTDWLQAENMPLKYAIARLNRYSPERISLGDASKAEATLNGRFNLRNTDGTLQMISALLKLKTVRRGGGLSLEDARSN